MDWPHRNRERSIGEKASGWERGTSSAPPSVPGSPLRFVTLRGAQHKKLQSFLMTSNTGELGRCHRAGGEEQTTSLGAGGRLQGRGDALGEATTPCLEPSKQDSKCRQGRNQPACMVKSTPESPLHSATFVRRCS